jgi:hypothetical protein
MPGNIRRYIMKVRRALLALAGAGGLLFAVVPVAAAASSPGATPAARFAAGATRYQNAAITEIMARAPGGTRVSAGEVVWRDGVIVNVPTAPRAKVPASPDQSFADCSYGYSCVYSQTGWNGIELMCPSSYLNGGTYFCPIYQQGFGSGGLYSVESWVNYTAYRAWLQQYDSHTSAGNEYCETPRYGNNSPSYNSDFTGPVSLTANWVWMSNNTDSC